MVLSCTVSEIRRVIGWKLRIFPTPLLFGALAPKFPLEFRGEVNREETRVMRLPGGESCMIRSSTFLTDPPVWRTDRQTDERTEGRAIAYARYSIAVARKSYAALAEMFVAHSALPTYNAALNRPAYQSSVYVYRNRNMNANLANDGNHETNALKDNKVWCSHTKHDTNPWWAVDLGRPTTVYRVFFTNRGDSGGV